MIYSFFCLFWVYQNTLIDKVIFIILMVKNAVLSIRFLYKESNWRINLMFYNDFILVFFEKYQQKYQQKILLPPKKAFFT